MEERTTTNSLQSVTVNLQPTKRYELLEGRKYMVVPMVMLTEGVHAGSNGPLYYPSTELAKTPAVWNHKPVVVYHPTMNGQAISACEPAVISRRKVGLIMNTAWEPGKGGKPGKLKAEAWLEINRVKAVDDRVFNAVAKGEMMEVSTGLFTDNEAADGVWGKGKERYESIARNYRPDHLAILPDEKGACSIADGAGLMRNSAISYDETRTQLNELVQAAYPNKTNTASYLSPWVCDVYEDFCIYSQGKRYLKQGYTVDDTGNVSLSGTPVEVRRRLTYTTLDGTTVNTEGAAPVTKSQIVNALISNEATQWVDTDRDTLMTLSTSVLTKMLPPTDNAGDDTASDGHNDDNGETLEDGEGQVKPKKQGSKTGATANAGAVTNADASKKKKDEESDDEACPPGMKMNAQAPQSVEEYIANAPAGMRDVLAASLRSHNAEKVKLIGAITANKANRFTKPQLMAKGLEELQALAALARSTAPVEAPRQNNFAGLGDVSGGDELTENEEQEALPLPTINYERVSAGKK